MTAPGQKQTSETGAQNVCLVPLAVMGRLSIDTAIRHISMPAEEPSTASIADIGIG